MSDLESKDAVSLIDYPRVLLEQVEAVLRSVGLDVPAVLSQAFLLIFCLVVAILLWRHQYQQALQKMISRIAAVGTTLVALGILLSWVSEVIWPLPDSLQGHVEWSDLSPQTIASLRVELLDVRMRSISTEGGWVDSESGLFRSAYEKSFGDRPYYLRILAAGCEPLNVPLSYSRLRANSEVTVSYSCTN